MIGARFRSRPLLWNLSIALFTAVTGLLSAQSGASATANLSSVVLSESLPGFVTAPPGIHNGSITQSNIASVLGETNPAVSALGDQLAIGDVAGYLRAWTPQPTNGDAVVISAFQFQTQEEVNSFFNGVTGGLQQQAGVAQFDVSGVPDAVGYALHTTGDGGTLTEYVVPFWKGTTYFQVSAVTKSGDITNADAARVAGHQWAAASTPRDWTPVIRLGFFTGSIVISTGIVLVARRRKYSVVFNAPPPRPPVPVRWSPQSPSHVQP